MASILEAPRRYAYRSEPAPAARPSPQEHPVDRQAGPESGAWARFAALSGQQRRALVGCAAGLISGYCGIALAAAGFESVAGSSHPSLAWLLVPFGTALAANGFARAYRRIARERDESA